MTRPPLTAGIDPGGKTTGIILRQGTRCLDAQLFSRYDDQEPEDYALAAGCYLNAVLYDWHEAGLAAPLVRVERVVPPSAFVDGRKRFLNPADLIGVSLTLGAILAELATATEHDTPLIAGVELVRPARHGATPKALKPGRQLDRWMAKNYPAACLPDKRGTAYTDDRRHIRSAWDISKTKGVAI